MRELVFVLTRAQALVLARGLVLVSASVQVSMWALALVQALVQALVSALMLALSQASVLVSSPVPVQASAHSCPPPCRVLSRRSSDRVLRRVALQGQGAQIASVVPRSRCKS